MAAFTVVLIWTKLVILCACLLNTCLALRTNQRNRRSRTSMTEYYLHQWKIRDALLNAEVESMVEMCAWLLKARGRANLRNSLMGVFLDKVNSMAPNLETPSGKKWEALKSTHFQTVQEFCGAYQELTVDSVVDNQLVQGINEAVVSNRQWLEHERRDLLGQYLGHLRGSEEAPLNEKRQANVAYEAHQSIAPAKYELDHLELLDSTVAVCELLVRQSPPESVLQKAKALIPESVHLGHSSDPKEQLQAMLVSLFGQDWLNLNDSFKQYATETERFRNWTDAPDANTADEDMIEEVVKWARGKNGGLCLHDAKLKSSNIRKKIHNAIKQYEATVEEATKSISTLQTVSKTEVWSA
eukprot:Filipodium_phascolosomae@DN6829_c0_g1_i1.p1